MGDEPAQDGAAPTTSGDEGSGADPEPVAGSTDGAHGRTAALRARMERGKEHAEQLFHRYEDRPGISLGVRIWERDRQSAGTLISSAIAFRLFLFFVPLTLFAVGLTGFLRELVSAEDVEATTGVSGTIADQIRVALDQPGTTRWLATLVGLVGMFTTGRSLSKVLYAASSLAWRTPVVTRARLRVVWMLVGLITVLALGAVLVNRFRMDHGIPAGSMSLAVAFGVYAVVWLLVLAQLPRPTSDPGALIPGAVIASAVLCLLQAITLWYMPRQLDNASELYGAIGTTVVTLGWFFLVSRSVVIGMAVNAVVYERYGSISQLVFALPVLRILPRRFAAVRRYFELEHRGQA